VAIGTAGRWLLGAPGYQQYLPNSEREFTTGVASRNTPVINGRAQTAKEPQVLSQDVGDDEASLELELAACYPAELRLSSLRRRVALRGRRTVLVRDRIEGTDIGTVEYYWHGHPDAAWWVEDG